MTLEFGVFLKTIQRPYMNRSIDSIDPLESVTLHQSFLGIIVVIYGYMVIINSGYNTNNSGYIWLYMVI